MACHLQGLACKVYELLLQRAAGGGRQHAAAMAALQQCTTEAGALGCNAVSGSEGSSGRGGGSGMEESAAAEQAMHVSHRDEL